MSEQRETVMIAAFGGWNDACQAATNAVHHLVNRYDAYEIRHISCDGYYDYQVSRPTLCRVSGRARIVWPQTTFYDIAISPTMHVYAQIAPEPNYRWREYCRQTLRIADELDVDHIITLGSMFAECTHTRPLPLDICDTLDCSRARDCDKYSGPVGISTVLEDLAREQSFKATSIWVSIPQYTGNDECPPGTLALLRALGGELDAVIDTDELETRCAAWKAKASMLMHCSDQLADYVHHIEREWDKRHRDTAESPHQAEQLIRETEDFLKNL